MIIFISILLLYLIITIKIYYPNKNIENLPQDFEEIKTVSLKEDFSISEEIEKNNNFLLSLIKDKTEEIYYFDKEGNLLSSEENSKFFRKILGKTENGDLIIQDFYANGFKANELMLLEKKYIAIWNLREEENIKNRVGVEYDANAKIEHIMIIDIENTIKEGKLKIYEYVSTSFKEYEVQAEDRGMEGVEFILDIDFSKENLEIIVDKALVKNFDISLNKQGNLYHNTLIKYNNTDEYFKRFWWNFNVDGIIYKASWEVNFYNREFSKSLMTYINKAGRIQYRSFSDKSIEKEHKFFKEHYQNSIDIFRNEIDGLAKFIEKIKNNKFVR